MTKIILRLIALIVVLIAGLLAMLWFFSPQKTTPFLNQSGDEVKNSVAEIRSLEINGVQQRILIRGVDRRKPVLLHVHGGPGVPDQAVLQSFGKTLEDLFVVVYWDQRGAGASYSSTIPHESITLNQIVADGVELSRWLKREFSKDKIYLQGHSWGTLLGTNMISQAPDLYHAYFGIGQFANAHRSEILSYNYALKAAKQANDKSTIKGLTEIGSPPYSSDQEWIQAVEIQRGLLLPYELPGKAPIVDRLSGYKIYGLYSGYSIADKLAILPGIELSLKLMWKDIVVNNLFESHLSFDVPIYIFQGKYDQHTSSIIAKEYFDVLKAPHKEYFNFDNSAHWPHVREYQKYRKIVEEIIKNGSVTN